jgi:hypothetical protein
MQFKYTCLAFLYLTFQTNCSTNDEITFIRSLIKLSFESANCLYLIQDHLHHSDLVSAVLQNLQLVSTHIENVKLLKTFICDGYIVLSNNKQTITELFSTKTINIAFRPHKRVLLFTENWKDLDKELLSCATELHDLDLLIVQLDQNKTRKKMLSGSLKPSEVINIVSVYHNKIINRGFHVEQQYLTRQRWRPEVVLSKFNRTFSAVLFKCPPFVDFNEKKQSYSGVDIEILMAVLKGWPKEFISLSTDSSEHLYGEALQKVIDNENDVAVCSQWQQMAYGFDIDKSVEYTKTCRTLLIRRPELLPNYSFIFQSLQLDLWLLSFLILIISSLVMLLMSYIANKFITIENFLKNDFTLAVTYSLRIFSLGPISRVPPPQQFSLRLLIIIISIFCMLVTIYYSAGLTMSLRFPRFSKNINTLQDVVDSNIIWLDPDDYLKGWMANTTSKLLQKLSTQFELRTTISDCNKKLRDSKYALMVQVPPNNDENYVMFADTLDSHGRTHLKLLSQRIACFYCLFPMKVNSPYLIIFNRAISSFVEYGFIDQWYTNFVNRKRFRYMTKFFQRYSSEVFQNIDLYKLQGTFHILILGHLLAGIIFCIECAISKWQTRNCSHFY